MIDSHTIIHVDVGSTTKFIVRQITQQIDRREFE
jgi:hypothetical protein